MLSQAVSSWGTLPPPPSSAAKAAEKAFCSEAFELVLLMHDVQVQCSNTRPCPAAMGSQQQDQDALTVLAACMAALQRHQFVLLATSNLNNLLAGVQQQQQRRRAPESSSARGDSNNQERGSAAPNASAAPGMQRSAALGSLLVHNGDLAAVLLALLEVVVRLTSRHIAQKPAKRQVQAAASQLFGQQATDPSYWRAIASALRLLCVPSLGGAQPEALPVVSPSGGSTAGERSGHAPAFCSSSSSGGGGSSGSGGGDAGGSRFSSSSARTSGTGLAAGGELTARWQSLLDGWSAGSRTSAAINEGERCFKLHDVAMASPNDLHHSGCSVLDICCAALKTGWRFCRAGWVELQPDIGPGTTAASDDLDTLQSPDTSDRVFEALSTSGALDALCEVLLELDPRRPSASQCEFAAIRDAWDLARGHLMEAAGYMEWVEPDTEESSSSTRGGSGGSSSSSSSHSSVKRRLLLQELSGPTVQRLLVAVAETSLQEVLQDSSIVLPLGGAVLKTSAAGAVESAAGRLAAAAGQAATPGPAAARATHSDQQPALSSAASCASGSGGGRNVAAAAAACARPAGPCRWPLLKACPLHHAVLPSVSPPAGPLHGTAWAALAAGRLWRCAILDVEAQLTASGRPDQLGGC